MSRNPFTKVLTRCRSSGGRSRKGGVAGPALGVALSAIVLAATGCGGGNDRQSVELAFQLPTSEMSDADAARFVTLDRVAVGDAPLGPGQTPGYLFGVWDPDRGVFRNGYGLASREDDTAAEPEQSFRIGTVTKTFTATAVLLLVDDGKVRLDEPVTTYVGDLVDALPAGRRATVRQLLQMTSGFPDYANPADGAYAETVLDPSKVWTPEELVAVAAKHPGTERGRFAYSNTNYVVLGALVERVSGDSFGDFVRDRVLDPLGLEHTSIPSPPETADVDTHGYLNASWADFEGRPARKVLDAVQAGEDVTSWSTSVGGAAGNGVSTLDDLATWAAADFGDVLLADATRAERLKTVPSDSVFPGSTFGLGIIDLAGWHWFGGEILGWESLLMADPKSGSVVANAGNACCGVGLTNLITAAEALPALKRPILAGLTPGGGG